MAAEYSPVSSLPRAERDYVETARRWQADSNHLEVAWQFGRACFDLADAATNNAQRAQVAKQGVEVCRHATILDPKSAPAYYYLGLNLGQLARARPLSAVGYLDDVEAAWLSAIALDPKFDYSGPHRSIGVLYRDAPGWPISLGSRKKALFHLEKAVELSPGYPGNRLFLLETWIDWGRKDNARAALDETRKIFLKAREEFAGDRWSEDWRTWEARWEKLQKELD
jgi:tetratricopeptide (TPR) repeat protein